MTVNTFSNLPAFIGMVAKLAATARCHSHDGNSCGIALNQRPDNEDFVQTLNALTYRTHHRTRRSASLGTYNKHVSLEATYALDQVQYM